MPTTYRVAVAATFLIATSALSVAPAFAQAQYEVLAEFGGTGGERPMGGLIKGLDGAYYGTTQFSDTTACGIVYRMTSDGTVTIIHEFAPLAAGLGCRPIGELVQAPDGALYGVTTEGGPYTSTIGAIEGTGTVFKVTPAGTFTMLHSFAPFDEVTSTYPEGKWPYGSLALGLDGNLYGVTNYGGVQGAGTLFRITPAGVFTLLHSFDGTADGAFSNSGLIRGVDGNFYGTLASGGSTSNGGSVFRATSAGVVTKLFAFPSDSTCNCAPYGVTPVAEPVQDAQGNLYGTSLSSGPGATETARGTVWKLAPSGEMTLLHAFTGAPDGADPWAGLTLGSDGAVYGTTKGNGSEDFPPTVFRVTKSGVLTTLDVFPASLGGPDGRLWEDAPGVWVGTNTGGGTDNKGLIFRLAVPPGNLQISAIKAPPATAPGATMTVNDTTRNAGTSTVGTSITRIWLSLDTALDSDLELGARFLPALPSGARHAGATVVTVPEVTPGKYYLIAQADADGEVSESSETDNVRVKAIVIGPDLTIQALTFSPSSPSSTTPTTITITVKNGGASAGPSVTRIYRSANGRLDASDTLLAEVPLSGLDAATVATQTATVSLPAGTYYVIAVCDAAGALSEANEGNNLKKVLKTVTP